MEPDRRPIADRPYDAQFMKERHQNGVTVPQGLAEAQSRVTLTRDQERSGSNVVIDAAMRAVSGPRSFWYTSPSGPAMNVVMPLDSYTAGHATNANPPVIRPD